MIVQVITPLVSAEHRIVPFNDVSTAVEFETPLFSGTALLLLRNMPNTPKGVFEGKRRQMVWTVQVRLQCLAFERLNKFSAEHCWV